MVDHKARLSHKYIIRILSTEITTTVLLKGTIDKANFDLIMTYHFVCTYKLVTIFHELLRTFYKCIHIMSAAL